MSSSNNATSPALTKSTTSTMAMTPAKFLLAVDLNDAAADLVTIDEFELASRALRDALEVLSLPSDHPPAVRTVDRARALLEFSAQRQRSQEQQESSATSSGSSKRRKKREEAKPSSSFQTSSTVSSSESTHPLLIYAVPLKLAPCAVELPLLLEELSSVVLFNLALSYHLRAEAMGSSSATQINTAAQFYHMSKTMLNRAAQHVLEPAHCYIILGGILNNLGQIAFESGHYNEAREYFEKLVTLRSSQSALWDEVSTLDDDQNQKASEGQRGCWDVFDLNAFVIRGMNSASAA